MDDAFPDDVEDLLFNEEDEDEDEGDGQYFVVMILNQVMKKNDSLIQCIL